MTEAELAVNMKWAFEGYIPPEWYPVPMWAKSLVRVNLYPK